MAFMGANEAGMHQALSQIPLPPATRHQSLLYLAHIGKIFYCLLGETMKNQPDDNSTAVFEDLSEAFYKSLFDLKILTHALLEGQFCTSGKSHGNDCQCIYTSR